MYANQQQSTAPVLAPLAQEHFQSWLPLWLENNLGKCDRTITAQTWSRLCDSNSAVKGIGAFMDGQLAGFLHYILHPVTGSLNNACYMQDVFVDKNFRQRGIARGLVQALAAEGKRNKWARIYWLAERNNDAAQKLYEKIGVKLDFTLHVILP